MERKEKIAIVLGAAVLILPVVYSLLTRGVPIVSEFRRFDRLEGIQGIPGVRDLPSNATVEDLLVVLREAATRPCITGIEVDWRAPVDPGQEGDHGRMRIDSAVLSERTFATRHETLSSSIERVHFLIEDFCHSGVLLVLQHSDMIPPFVSEEPWETDGAPNGLPKNSLRLVPSGHPHPLIQVLAVAESSRSTLVAEDDAWVLMLDISEVPTESLDLDLASPIRPVHIAFSRSHGGPIWAKWWKDGSLNAEIEVLRFETFDDLSEDLFVYVPTGKEIRRDAQPAQD